MRIILVGYMASGKSSVGQILAERLAMPFVDTDQWIEDYAGQTISELFESRGEEYFRKLESEAIAAITKKYDRVVIATGGGLPMHNELMDVLLDVGQVVYLKVSIRSILERTKASVDRPLLNNKSANEIKRHYAGRRMTYNRAPIRVWSRGLPSNIVNRIASKLAKP